MVTKTFNVDYAIRIDVFQSVYLLHEIEVKLIECLNLKKIVDNPRNDVFIPASEKDGSRRRFCLEFEKLIRKIKPLCNKPLCNKEVRESLEEIIKFLRYSFIEVKTFSEYWYKLELLINHFSQVMDYLHDLGIWELRKISSADDTDLFGVNSDLTESDVDDKLGDDLAGVFD